MVKYLLTDISINNSKGCSAVTDFAVPADVNEIQAWLQDFNFNDLTTEQAYESYIRSVLYYNTEVDFKFYEVDNSVEYDYYAERIWLADLADMRLYKDIELAKATFDICIPRAHVVELDDEKVDLSPEEIETLIFEQIIFNMPVSITNIRVQSI